MLFFVLAAASLLGAFEARHDRLGLPEVKARIAEGRSLRVAYLGGSITASAGWRTLTTDFLKRTYPQLEIVEIAAALPGTGSDLGVSRLEIDVLQKKPDLLFVEFAVNDHSTAPEQIERTMEGIVRQTWRHLPATDLCFVYTLSTPGLPELQAGRYQQSALAMEKVAEHYGIPTLHFGVAVVQRLAEGSLVFKEDKIREGITFSTDGVHPSPAGHAVYAKTLAEAWPLFLAAAKPRPSPLPEPLHADNWQFARQLLITPPMQSGTWTTVATDDANLRGTTRHLLPTVWRTEVPGSSIEFTFQGSTLGLLGIAAPDNGEFEVTVDDQPPVTATFFDHYVTPTFCRQRAWFYPHPLQEGTHRVRVTLTARAIDKKAVKDKAGKELSDVAPFTPQRLTLCSFLLRGASAP